MATCSNSGMARSIVSLTDEGKRQQLARLQVLRLRHHGLLQRCDRAGIILILEKGDAEVEVGAEVMRIYFEALPDNILCLRRIGLVSHTVRRDGSAPLLSSDQSSGSAGSLRQPRSIVPHAPSPRPARQSPESIAVRAPGERTTAPGHQREQLRRAFISWHHSSRRPSLGRDYGDLVIRANAFRAGR